MADHMTPAEMREAANRLRGDILDAVPDDNDMQHVLEMSAEALDRLADVIELHLPQHGAQGYLPGGTYGWIDEVCPQCGHADEYGIASPCPTLRITRGDTTNEEASS